MVKKRDRKGRKDSVLVSISRALFLSVTFATGIVVLGLDCTTTAESAQSSQRHLLRISQLQVPLCPPTLVPTAGLCSTVRLVFKFTFARTTDIIILTGAAIQVPLYPSTLVPTAGLRSTVRLVFIVAFARTTDIMLTGAAS